MSTPSARRLRRPGHHRLITVAAAAAAASLTLSACGGSDSEGASGGDDSAPAASGECGSIPEAPPADPQGVLAGLPPEVADDYNGLTTEVLPSAWADWQPDHAGPFRVGVIWAPPTNTFQTETLDGLISTLEESGDVDVIANLAPNNQADIPGELQQFNQVVAQDPDLVIVQPLAPGPFVGAIDAAGQAGIPVLSAWNATPSKYAVSVAVNNWLQAASTAADVVTEMGGEGSVLLAHGVPGIQQDSDAMAGFQAVLDLCPGIEVIGEVTGNYNQAATQAATIQFLSSHPGQIDGVFQSGVMTAGVIQAFQQLGRPVPAIADVGSTKGSVAYANENESEYLMSGTSTPDARIGEVIGEVALRLLAGEGPVLNQLITEPTYITGDNLAEVYQDGWDLSTTGNAAVPDDAFISDEQLTAFFGTQG
jgi:ribose transport system substrate-binding protein